MSAHRDVPGWCEHRPGRSRAVAHIVDQRGVVADYPADKIELAAGMGRAVIEAVASDEEGR